MTPAHRSDTAGPALSNAGPADPPGRVPMRQAVAAALLAVVLTAGAVWAVPASADAQESVVPLWSADMSVTEYTSVSIGAASADLFSNVGGSGSLQIRSLWSHLPERDLRLAFADGVPDAADYTLVVGDLSLEFAAGSSGASSFRWSGVDVGWEDGQVIRVRIVRTADVAVLGANVGEANSEATGEPAVSGAAQVGETLTADTSGIDDADGLSNVFFAYRWMRGDADIADATESTYELGDDDLGKTIAVRVSFVDDKANSETLTSAATAEVRERPQFLVANLNVGVAGAGGIQRTLNTARSGFAQAFTTGPRAGGYTLGSVSVQVSHLFDASTAGDNLRVTINSAASDSGPGDALCTLAGPSSFSAPGVVVFDAATGEGACAQLAAGTTYFVVVEWVSPSGTDAFALIPQTYPTDESAATAEDPGGADGWSIADNSHYLTTTADTRTWTAYDETASFKIKVTGTVSEQTTDPETETETESETDTESESETETETDTDTESESESETETESETAAENSSPTGAPAITGIPQVEQTLTADTSGIDDADGLRGAVFSYQWVRNDGTADTDIDAATASTYTLVDADQGSTVKVTVSFTDDAANAETLTSAATDEVAPAPLTAWTQNVPTAHDGLSRFSFELKFSENFGVSYKTLRDKAFSVTGGTVKQARRLDRPHNTHWRIVIQPRSAADVTVVLPVPDACDDTGAICADDDRKLSNRLEFTISGSALSATAVVADARRSLGWLP
ncbi:hypothetical protein [Candidatus Poriferisodalis sp.]|uniref:hypothetical protein n=1 Tax=Candidatus Poriferisodalis sp. TaxID=3101277 RepID=UPI003AF46044